MTSYVFTDPRIQFADQPLTGYGPDTIFVSLDSAQDGLTQIAQALAGQSGIDAIHIVSHGSAGRLYLGTSILTAENMDRHSTELATIGLALKAEGYLLIYGCDVGAGEPGQQWVSMLATLTSADVAASNNPTGSAALGGDWVLETSAGAVEEKPLTSAFDGLLLAPVLTPAGALDTSFDGDGKLVIPGSVDVWTFSSSHGFNANQGSRSGADVIRTLILRPDGNLIAAGPTANNVYSVVYDSESLSWKLDPGSDNGYAIYVVNKDGLSRSYAPNDVRDPLRSDYTGNGIALQLDDKIIVAATKYVPGYGLEPDRLPPHTEPIQRRWQCRQRFR